MPPHGFDLDNDGVPDLTSWTRVRADEVFLVLDRDADGLVDDGSEFFGSSTELSGGGLARHGFEALAEFDRPELGGNSSGEIDPADRVFGSLALWQDLNRNGTTERAELSSLAAAGVVGISLEYSFDPFADHWGNELGLWSRVRMSNGEMRRAIDVFLKRFDE